MEKELQFQMESGIDFIKSKKVKILGMIVPDEQSAFYHQLAEETAAYAFQQGYTVF